MNPIAMKSRPTPENIVCNAKLPKVFESVIAWIQHSAEARAQHLPSLMEHIRLPLLSQDYLIHKVFEKYLPLNSIMLLIFRLTVSRC